MSLQHKPVVYGILITTGEVNESLLQAAIKSAKAMEEEVRMSTARHGTKSVCVSKFGRNECGLPVIMTLDNGWQHTSPPHMHNNHEVSAKWDFEQTTEKLPGFDEGAAWAEGRISRGLPAVATTNEVRITNEKTGGQKGSKDAKYHLIPAGPLKELAELYGVGAKKYAPRNWELGYDWSLSYDALQRHANQFWAGEDKDEETGKSHLASVIFHAMALMQFAEEHPELDDRPTTKNLTAKTMEEAYRNAMRHMTAAFDGERGDSNAPA